MSQLLIILTAFATSVITTMTLMPWLLSLCHKHELTDTTNDRHHFRIPRIGGMVFAPAMLIGVATSVALRMINESISDTLKPSSFLIIIGVTIVYLLGIIDDLLGMTKWQKRLVIITTSIAFPLIGLYINNLHGLFGIWQIGYPEGFILTMTFTILIVKAIEAMNNIDGLAAVTGLVPLTAFGIVFYLTGRYNYATVALTPAGTLLVFLYYNLYGDEKIGTKAYMGHAGQLIMSYSVVYLSLKYAMDNPLVMQDRTDAILLPYTLLALPVFEYIRVFIKSNWQGMTKKQRINSYVQHQLQRKGFTQSEVVGVIFAAEAAITAINLLLHHYCDVATTWIVLLDIIVYAALQTLATSKIKAPKQEATTPGGYDGYKGEAGLVSIIMPTWNSARYVADSIDSILAQTYTDWELIITDDCSTDNTREILRKYAARDPRITIQENTVNSGAGVTRNRSIATARGQYIAFCDSDDRWVPEKLQQQVEYMRDKDVALCFSPYYTCDESSQYLGYISAPRRITLFQMMCDNKIGFLTCIYDTDVFGKRPMPTQRKGEDYGLLLQLLKICGNAYSVQQPLAHYRIRPDSQSANKISLIKYNAQTYTDTFGWPTAASYAFLFMVFLPSYFLKRLKNIMINIVRAA